MYEKSIKNDFAALRPIKRIGLLRALYLGDWLCAIPAVRSIRQTFPDAHIDLIGLPWTQPFVKRFSHYFDGFVEFPGFPGIPEGAFEPKRFTAFLQETQAIQYDLVFQLHGDGTLMNPAALLIGGRITAGFYRPGNFCPNPKTFIPYPNTQPEIRRLLALPQHLGFVEAGEALEFPVTHQDRSEIQHLFGDVLLPNRYVCVHPGSRGIDRRAAPVTFARFADLYAQAGFTVVLTGVADELPLVNAVAQEMKFQALVAAGKTSLGGMAALLESAHTLIANDTGVSHIAAALKVPSIILFTGSEPHQWAPLNRQLHQIVNGHDEQHIRQVLESIGREVYSVPSL